MDPTRHQDFVRMQQQINQAAEYLLSKLDRMNYAYISRQLQKWEDAIRHGRERTQRKNERIEQFLKSTPTCPGANCGGTLQKTEISENEKMKTMIGSQYDVKCDACKRIIYLPPVLIFVYNADEYICAARVLKRHKTQDDVAGVRVFLMHQAAELYLKSLGTCTLYDEGEQDDDSEDIGGESRAYTAHNLRGLFEKVYPFLQNELEEYEREAGKRRMVENLVNAIPSQTSEIFRYGFLLRGEYPEVTISSGDALVKGKNISQMLLDLCTHLENFTRVRALL